MTVTGQQLVEQAKRAAVAYQQAVKAATTALDGENVQSSRPPATVVVPGQQGPRP